MQYALFALFGYLLGSCNASVIISKMRGKDIRTVGSGNAGATNTLRTFGKGAAAIVVVIDLIKGIAAVLIGRYCGNEYMAYIAGFAAILGHNFPVYFSFRGGKGIVTSLAVMTTVYPLLGVITLVFALLVIAITRYVSLGSVLGALLFGILALILGADIYFKFFACATVLLAVLRHAGNIGRLFHGTERKLGV